MKRINLVLAYPKTALEDRRGITVEGRFLPGVVLDGRFVPIDLEILTPAMLTRRLVTFAVSQVYPQIEKKPGRIWARIKRAMDASDGEVELPVEQFDWLFDLVEKCKYPSVTVDAVELLWDELEAVKLRKAD